jgi:hypothetical protein
VSIQAPSAVVLVRPHHFTPNPLTAGDNVFQSPLGGADSTHVASAAFDEVTRTAEALGDAGIRVHLFDDESPDHPDSVFPNNWMSTHPGGHVAIYPMFAVNRRGERRTDVIDMLKNDYRVQDVIDYSGLELDDVFLEGTGAIVLDHASRVAYVARSHRADPIALERFCTNFGYEPMVFDAADPTGTPIYHTNVMMGVATDFALVGLGLIRSPARRGEIVDRLTAHGRTDRPNLRAGVRLRRERDRARLADRPRARPLPPRRGESPGRPARGHRAFLHDPATRHPDHRAGGRFGALHDRGNPPRSATGSRALRTPVQACGIAAVIPPSITNSAPVE